MNKSASQSGTAEEPPLVSSSDVGRRVGVAGVGEGLLRYVGGIDGKSGLFCGIELDAPEGKHDGSFEGFAYFSCHRNHGIFAPLYKVRLLDCPLPTSKTFLLNQQLSRSALPSLQLREVFAPDREDPMDSSLLNESYVLNGSMNGSWNFGDDMLQSNNTYVLPHRMPDDEEDLMAIEAPESILDRVLSEMPIGTSLVLEQSRVGVENLPVIGSPLHRVRQSRQIESQSEEEEEEEEEDDYDAKTPMVEMKELPMECDSPPPDPSSSLPPPSPMDTSGDDYATAKKEPEKKKVEEKPKKERPPLVPQAAPKFPVKPKGPSKSQLMMEKLKASMEAEKAAPKKAPRPRPSLLPSPPEKKKHDENDSDMPSTAPRPPSAMSTGKTPLRQSNGPLPSAPRPSTSPRKPRVSLLPPPPAKNEEPKKAVTKGGATARPRPPPSTFPTSSFAPKVATPKAPNNDAKKKTKGGKEKEIDEGEKRRRLQRAATAFDGLLVCLSHLQKVDTARSARDGAEKSELQSKVEHLVARLGEAEACTRKELEELHTANENAIAAMRMEMTKQGEASEAAATATLDEERTRHTGEVAEMTRRHQQTCALLDEKNAEAERTIEELQNEKKALQKALENDHDTKVQMLSQEISSLNTALQLRTSEMKELRLRNQHLTMQVDEIPAKDLDITKLRHKIVELKGTLEQKMDREKLLVQQNEELRRRERTSTAMTESYRKDVDVLRFQLGLSQEAGDTSDDGGSNPADESAYFTPSATVRLRNGGRVEEGRPYSYTLPSAARLSHGRSSCDGGEDLLTRSAIGILSANRPRPSALDEDVIYAPDALIATPRRGHSSKEEATDSGIGL